MNSARAFMRREDCAPRTTPAASPFREFLVSCLHCGSYQVRTVVEFHEEADETWLVLRCGQCGRAERLAAGFKWRRALRYDDGAPTLRESGARNSLPHRRE